METRRDKLQSRPRQFHLISQEQVLADVPVIDKQRIKEQESEKDESINRLIELCDKFNIGGLKKKLLKKTNKSIVDLAEQKMNADEKEYILMSFLDKLLQDHEKNVNLKSHDVFDHSLKKYSDYLREIEAVD